MCFCVREREREQESERARESLDYLLFFNSEPFLTGAAPDCYLCLCVRKKERESARASESYTNMHTW